MLVGVGWYTVDQWTMLKLMADDPSSLDSTYEQWQAGAERALQRLNREPGIRAVKVAVDVQLLREWCRNKGKRLDGEARAVFIAEQVQNGTFSDPDA